MISITLFAPLLVALVLCGSIASLHKHLPPSLVARLLAAGLLVVMAAVVPTAWSITVVYLWHVPAVHATVGWCTAVVSSHHSMPPSIGLGATAVAVLGTLRSVRYLRTFRRLCRHDVAPALADHPHPFAVTMPGRDGRVVLSAGLLQLLDQRECAVVLAHERAHAYCRHDRYLVVARVAERFLPPLRPIADRLRLALERWADEHAVDEVGDRQLVARTLRKVALQSAGISGALAFESVGVVRRIEALRASRVVAPGHALVAALGLVLLGAAAASGLQLHHLGDLLLALCAG